MRLVPTVNDPLWRCLCPRAPIIRVALPTPAKHPLPRNTDIRQRPGAKRRGYHHASSTSRQEEVDPEPPVTEETAVRVKCRDFDIDQFFRGIGSPDYPQVQNAVERSVRHFKHKPDHRIYEALLLANLHTKYGSAEEVDQLLKQCADAGIAPTSRIYHAALRALAVHPNHLLRDDILEKLREHWFDLSDAGHHDVAVGMLRERQVELAIQWIEGMEVDKHDVQPWLYDMLTFCLCDLEEFDEALRLLRKRFDHVPKDSKSIRAPSANVWYYFLDAASRAMHYEGTSYAFNARVATGYLNPPDGMCTNVLTCVARNGDTKLATAAFNVLSKRAGNAIKLHHYETLTEAYLNRNDLYTALSLLTVAQSSGHLLTSASTRPFFMYLNKSLDTAFLALDTLETMREEDRPIPVAAINVFIESFIRYNHLEGAVYLYDTLNLYRTITPTSPGAVPLRPDVETYTLLLQGCVTEHDKPKAMFLAQEMVRLKIAPTAPIYDRLVAVCMHCDEDLEDAWRYVMEMREAGLKLTEETINDMTKRAERLGDHRFELLESVRDRLPTGADTVGLDQRAEDEALSSNVAAGYEGPAGYQSEREDLLSDYR